MSELEATFRFSSTTYAKRNAWPANQGNLHNAKKKIGKLIPQSY